MTASWRAANSSADRRCAVIFPDETGHEIDRRDSLAKWWCSLECVLSRMTAKTSSKKPAATKVTALAAPRARRAVVDGGDARFSEVVALIEAARGRAYQAVNAELVAHYWELGEYISRKIASDEDALAAIERLARPKTANLHRFYVDRSGSKTRIVSPDEVLERAGKAPERRQAWASSIEVVWAESEADAIAEVTS
jgi:hypothetical protein